MTDALDYGIGGFLYQEVDGEKQLVALGSKSLTKTRLKWSVIQKETFALYYCCTYLDVLLRDRKFTILTDHKNLTFLEKDKNKNEMVGRWRMALQELEYTIGYIPGKQNEIADAISRLCKNRMPPKTGIIAAILTTEQYNLIATCHNTIVGHGGVQRTLRNLKKTNNIWLGQ